MASLGLNKSAFTWHDRTSVGSKSGVFTQASVSGLFKLRRPSTVIRRVWSVVVIAVDRMLSCGFRTHIGKEVLKRIKPSLADGNSTCAVIVEGVILSVETSGFHSLPRQMLRSACQSMRPGNISKAVTRREAPATDGHAFSEVITVNSLGCAAASTPDNPSGFASAFRVIGASNDGQFAECLTSYLEKRHGQFYYGVA